MRPSGQKSELTEYLDLIGIPELPPLTSLIDAGYDLTTVEGHFEQSGHLMASYKISMATWMIAAEHISKAKIAVARQHGVPVVTGGGPFELAATHDRLPEYLDLCARFGVDRIESGAGFSKLTVEPQRVVDMAHDRGLAVQFEVGDKHGGPFGSGTIDAAIQQAADWLEAGAEFIVVEARESGENVGLFSEDAVLNVDHADQLAGEFGLSALIFEAPTKSSQFALINHFGRMVQLGNVRLEELLRVEIYRRGMHADAFVIPELRTTHPVGGLIGAKRGTRD